MTKSITQDRENASEVGMIAVVHIDLAKPFKNRFSAGHRADLVRKAFVTWKKANPGKECDDRIGVVEWHDAWYVSIGELYLAGQ